MSEMRRAMQLLSGSMSTAILKYPSGRYGLVGSVPSQLTRDRGGLFPGRDSMIWESEQEAIDALLGIGMRRFQLANCSWFDLDAPDCVGIGPVGGVHP